MQMVPRIVLGLNGANGCAVCISLAPHADLILMSTYAANGLESLPVFASCVQNAITRLRYSAYFEIITLPGQFKLFGFQTLRHQGIKISRRHLVHGINVALLKLNPRSVADAQSLATAMGMQKVSENCKVYLEIVINEEWELMDHLTHSRKAEAVLDSIQLQVFSFKPSNLQEQSLFSAILAELNNVTDARLNRISRITDTMPWQMWFFLIPMGFLVVCYSYLFGIESGRAHMFMTAALALSIAYSLVITFNLQYPFSGALKVKPEAYEMVLAESFESSKATP